MEPYAGLATLWLIFLIENMTNLDTRLKSSSRANRNDELS